MSAKMIGRYRGRMLARSHDSGGVEWRIFGSYTLRGDLAAIAVCRYEHKASQRKKQQVGPTLMFPPSSTPELISALKFVLRKIVADPTPFLK